MNEKNEVYNIVTEVWNTFKKYGFDGITIPQSCDLVDEIDDMCRKEFSNKRLEKLNESMMMALFEYYKASLKEVA